MHAPIDPHGHIDEQGVRFQHLHCMCWRSVAVGFIFLVFDQSLMFFITDASERTVARRGACRATPTSNIIW